MVHYPHLRSIEAIGISGFPPVLHEFRTASTNEQIMSSKCRSSSRAYRRSLQILDPARASLHHLRHNEKRAANEGTLLACTSPRQTLIASTPGNATSLINPRLSMFRRVPYPSNLFMITPVVDSSRAVRGAPLHRALRCSWACRQDIHRPTVCPPRDMYSFNVSLLALNRTP